jgi:quercetin dioxygenase-like cupin family protein
MSNLYTFIPNVEDLAGEIKPDSITSRNFYKGEGLNAILFAFDTGQELSEHTSSKTAIIQIIKGKGRVTLGDEAHQVEAGAWIHMAANLKHSVLAETELIMILLMFDAV